MLYAFPVAVLASLLMQVTPHLQEYLADPLATADKLESRLKSTPTDYQIANELGQLYAACSLGATTVTSNGLLTGASVEKAKSETALECRKRLSEHQIQGVLLQGAYQLAFLAGQAKRFVTPSFDVQSFAEGLADKAVKGPNGGDVAMSQRLNTYRFRLSGTVKAEDRATQARSLVLLEEEAFVKAGSDNYRFMAATHLIKDCLVAQDWERTSKYAKFLLDSEMSLRGSWNYGNAIHDANVAMGEVALHNGDVKAAAGYLLAAGKTPGSPNLNSFGPNMTLARDLILAGDRKSVLEYFQLCGAFWKMDRGRLTDWSSTVVQGGMPNFGANVLY